MRETVGRAVARELGKGRVVEFGSCLKGLTVHTFVIQYTFAIPPERILPPSAGEQTKLDKDNFLSLSLTRVDIVLCPKLGTQFSRKQAQNARFL